MSNPVGSGSEQDIIRDLLSQKQALLMELKHYECNANFNEDLAKSTKICDTSGIIPASTRLQIGISTNDAKEKVKSSSVTKLSYKVMLYSAVNTILFQ